MRLGISATLALAALAAGIAQAAVTRFEVQSYRPFGTFRAGEFILVEGKVFGEIDPRLDMGIPGLDKAPRNSEGRVEYSARVVIVAPNELKRSNGTLIVDIPNRGRAYAQALFNSPRDEPFQSGTFEQGNGFLQDNGYMLAEVYWELGQGADLPSFVDADGKRHYVEGAGFAIVRDTADYLHWGMLDQKQKPNPLRGAVQRVIATGKSQSGRFLKSFLVHGFNDARGRRVFDGLEIFVSAAGHLPIWATGTESSGNGIPTFQDVEMRGYTEEPLSYAKLIANIPPANEALPKVMFINSTTDYYAIRSSLGRTGPDGTRETQIPSNVRVYDLAGASHVVVPKAPNCATHPGTLDWTPVSRALLLKLTAWVSDDVQPPDSRLMPLEPAAPDAALRAPAHLPNAVTEVPKRDADGNPLGGVRLPEVEAPLGTYVGLNATHNRACMLVGGWMPFALSKAQREAASDARLSVAERYKSRDEYVDRIRNAARELMHDGFLLADDAAIIVQSAASSRAFATLPPDSR